MEVNVNGKPTTLKMDFGAIRIFNKETDSNFMALAQIDLKDDDTLAYLFLAMAKRGNPKITMEDIDCLSVGQIAQFADAVQGLLKEFEGEVPDDVPLAESPQS